MVSTIFKIIEEELVRFGHFSHSEVVERMEEYVSKLLQWGKKIRLTGKLDPEIIVGKHMVDGFKLAATIKQDDKIKCADVGSGAGLPSIPTLILRPQLELTLIEANLKKSAFLRTVLHELGLKAAIESTRLEKLHLSKMDMVWSKATWPPDVWLKNALDLVIPGGTIGMFLTDFKKIPSLPLNTRLEKKEEYTLRNGSLRLFVVVRKDELETQP